MSRQPAITDAIAKVGHRLGLVAAQADDIAADGVGRAEEDIDTVAGGIESATSDHVVQHFSVGAIVHAEASVDPGGGLPIGQQADQVALNEELLVVVGIDRIFVEVADHVLIRRQRTADRIADRRSLSAADPLQGNPSRDDGSGNLAASGDTHPATADGILVAFDADAYVWELRREAGFVPELIEGPAVREAEPILAQNIDLLAVMKNHGFILNPAGYVKDLVKVLEAEGGRFIRAEVKDFDISGGIISAIETNQGRMECDRAVIATGVWSKPLMGKLGLNVPLEAERGYHIVYQNPNIRPNAPMMVTTGKFVATPTDEGLRCAGVVEFGGLKDEKSKAALKLMRKKVNEVFPTMHSATEEEWLGFRPAPSDSLPLVGEVGNTGVFTAFGHHHIGLTGGPKTGRMIADMVTGNTMNIDTTPFAPDRFAKGAKH